MSNFEKACELSLNDWLATIPEVVPEAEYTDKHEKWLKKLFENGQVATQYVDIDGNTYVYMGSEDGTVYKALFKDNEKLLFAKVGDTIKGSVVNGILTVE